MAERAGTGTEPGDWPVASDGLGLARQRLAFYRAVRVAIDRER